MSTPSVTPAELRQSLQILVDKHKGEAGQRGAVIRALAALGHYAAPKIHAGRMEGGTLRLYQWDFAGGIVLATGPNFVPKVFSPDDIQKSPSGVYIFADADQTRAGSRAEGAATRAKTRMEAKSKKAASARPRPTRSTRAGKKAAEQVIKATSHTTSRERKAVQRAVSKSLKSTPVVPAKVSLSKSKSNEIAELNNALKALLG